MRGRKPKPTALHKLAGTFNVTDHRHRKTEPIPKGDLLANPPTWMTKDQQEAWRYAVEHAPRHLLKLIDRGMLAVWVVAEDQHRIAAIMQALQDEQAPRALLTKNKDGVDIASPYLGIMNRSAMRMIKAAAELGFSPAARPRLASDDRLPDDDSPWAQLTVIDGGRP